MAESRLRLKRKVIICPIFGVAKRMKLDVLPTIRDLLEDYQWVRRDLRKHPVKEPEAFEIVSVLVKKVKEIWTRASVPTVKIDRITKLVRIHHDQYLKLIRYPACKRSANYEQKVAKFREHAINTLFDIASCKCSDPAACRCPKEGKIPVEERQFLKDQRTVRTMMIGSIDRPKTEKLMLRAQRKKDEAMRLTSSGASTSRSVDELDEHYSSDKNLEGDETDNGSSAGKEEMEDKKIAKTQHSQQRRRLTNTAQASERYGISDRAAADIASSLLTDFGIVTTGDKSEVIDRSKLRRERKRLREDLLQESASHSSDLRGLYFDGRKDKTLLQENIGGKLHRRTVIEEHIVLIEEPDSNYLGHIAPVRGSAECIKQAILDFFEERKISMELLAVMGCDGTAVNTGHKGGIIRLLEVHLKRPLHWFICLLHTNELPLRHLFEQLDGSTTGPRSFSGELGTQVQRCENMPMVKFQQIECDLQVLPDSVLQDLSTDQRYLYDMSQAVSSGICDEALLHRSPGKLVMSRWLTLANRILRLYVATKEPSNCLSTITEFVLKVYAPVWFAVKSKPSCKDGAKHLWMLANKSRYLPDYLKSIVDPVIQRNAFFAHPENVLLSMITDERKSIRELGIRRIMKARSSKKPQRGIRIFHPPSLNFHAADYTELIDWQSCEVTEPPLTKDINDDDLEQLIHNADDSAIDLLRFPKFPCHTQAVERSVKTVTESSLLVVGQHARDGLVRARLEARKIMPTYETKRDFNTK